MKINIQIISQENNTDWNILDSESEGGIRMGYFNDSIRWQQQIADQMSALKMSGVLDLVQNTTFMDNYKSIISATQGIRDTLEPLRHQFDYMKNLNLLLPSIEPPLTSNINLNANILSDSMLGSYEMFAGTAQSIAKVADITAPWIEEVQNISENLPDMSLLEKLMRDVVTPTIPAMSALENLNRILPKFPISGLDGALRTWDDIPEELEEDIQDIIAGEFSDSDIEAYDKKWGERGIKALKTVIKVLLIFIIQNFFGGYIGRLSEPIYKVIDQIPTFFERALESKQSENIPSGTEITVWSDETQDFVEVSYKINDEVQQCYIQRELLNENAHKISDGMQIEEIVYVNWCVEVMAEKWGVEESAAYDRICRDTETLEKFILPNYEALSTMEKEDVFKEIDEFYHDQIDLIKAKRQKDTDKNEKSDEEKINGKTNYKRCNVPGAEVRTSDSG